MNETTPNAPQMIELDETSLANVSGGLEVSYTTLAATAVGVVATAATGVGAVGIACVAAGALYSYFSHEAY